MISCEGLLAIFARIWCEELLFSVFTKTWSSFARFFRESFDFIREILSRDFARSYVILHIFYREADPRGFWLLREICRNNLDFFRGFTAHFHGDFLSFRGKGYLPVYEG